LTRRPLRLSSSPPALHFLGICDPVICSLHTRLLTSLFVTWILAPLTIVPDNLRQTRPAGGVFSWGVNPPEVFPGRQLVIPIVSAAPVYLPFSVACFGPIGPSLCDLHGRTFFSFLDASFCARTLIDGVGVAWLYDLPSLHRSLDLYTSLDGNTRSL